MNKIIRIIFNPKIWMLLYPIDLKWDKQLNELMDNYKFEDIDAEKYMCKINDTYIWISNYPYAAFDRCVMIDVTVNNEVKQFFHNTARKLPTRRTILRAHDKLLADTGIELLQELNYE